MRKKEEDSTMPEMTALMDVVFILLFFFLAATTFKKAENVINLELPHADGQKSNKDMKNFIISVKDDQYYFEKDIMNLTAILSRLKDRDGTNTEIVIRGDKKTSYDSVLNLLNELKNMGITTIYLEGEG